MDHCVWCDAELASRVSWHEIFGLVKRDMLCAACRNGLASLPEPLCTICGRTLLDLDESFRHDGDLCYDCFRWESGGWRGVLLQNRSLYRYNDFLQKVIAHFKYRGDVAMVSGFEKDWVRLYEKHFSGKVVVPIPLSKERLYERGFNQAFELARLLPAKICTGLSRVVHEQKQSKKTRDQRLYLERPVFRLSESSSEMKGKDVVLVDDIYTTGATVRQAAKVLLDGGAASVASMTLARG